MNISDKLRSQSLVADGILRQQLEVVLIDKIKVEQDVDNDEPDDDTTERLFCGICEINYDDVNDFDEHMKALHSSQWICSLCNEDCKTSDDLLRHKYKEHYDRIEESKEPDPDPPDEAVDSSEGNTSDHYVNVDSIVIKEEELPSKSESTDSPPREKKNIACNICNVIITTEKLMVDHEKMHEPRPMTCATCFREFPSPYDLFTHKQVIHKVYVDQKMKWFCDKCERFTASVQFLRRHKFCTKIKLKCKYCNMGFFKRAEMQIHQKVCRGLCYNVLFIIIYY